MPKQGLSTKHAKRQLFEVLRKHGFFPSKFAASQIETIIYNLAEYHIEQGKNLA